MKYALGLATEQRYLRFEFGILAVINSKTCGKQAFIDLGCGFCHSVSGVEGLREDFERPERTVVLGGEKSRLYSYGELVTSIINPSHKISQPELGNVVDDEGNSQMVNYNDIMTVTEMTDLVTFLEQHYSLKPYERTHYSPYYPY